MPRVEQRERTCDSAEGDWGFWDMVYGVSLPSFFWRGTEARAHAAVSPEALEVSGSGPNPVIKIKMILDRTWRGLESGDSGLEF